MKSSRIADSPAIGIDLGTINSCSGVWIDATNRVEIIPNDQGYRTTPSYVAFTDEETLVGDAALNQIASNPVNTIYGVKRFIGKKYNNPTVQEDLSSWPFKVEEGLNGKPVIAVTVKGTIKRFPAEEISAMILLKLKEAAEIFLNRPIKDAVITVPSFFNNSQREATQKAGEMAGLNVLRIINESTAAAIAYGLTSESQGERKVLIYDLGGGSFDVSLLSIDGGLYEVKATASDIHLGGEDFTSKLVEFCVADFAHKSGHDIINRRRPLRRLRAQCEKAKLILSSVSHTIIEVDSLSEAIDYFYVISRAKFEEICHPLFEKTILLVKQVLREAKVTKDKISDIVLIGGATRTPKISKLLTEFFEGKEPNKSINPEEAVACGAAIKASIIAGQMSKPVQDFLVVDVTSSSKGLETADEAMIVVIPRNSPIPIKKKQIVTTNTDNQSTIEIRVFEGESPNAEDNNLLGIFRLEEIKPAPKGVPLIEVIFEIDINGILNVSACDKETRKSKKIVILSEKEMLSQGETDKMRKEIGGSEMDDLPTKRRKESRVELENFCHFVHNALEDEKLKDKFTRGEKEELDRACESILMWIEVHKEAEEQDYIKKLKEISSMYNLIVFRTEQMDIREATINREYNEGPVTTYVAAYEETQSQTSAP